MTAAPLSSRWILIFLLGVAVGIALLVIAFAAYRRKTREPRGFDVNVPPRPPPGEPK